MIKWNKRKDLEKFHENHVGDNKSIQNTRQKTMGCLALRVGNAPLSDDSFAGINNQLH